MEEEAGTTEAEEAIKLSIKNTVKIRNVSIAISRDTHPRVSQRHKRMLTTHIIFSVHPSQKCNEDH